MARRDPSNVVNTEVEVQLGRTSSYPQEWSLTITDARSRNRIIEVRMDNDTLADMVAGAITGRHGRAEVYLSPAVGKYLVVETRVFDVGSLWGDEMKEAVAQEAFRLLEQDEVLSQPGWRYGGASGGAGGSRHRTLVFRNYTNTPPEDS